MRIATFIIALAAMLAILSTGCTKKSEKQTTPKIEPQHSTIDPKSEPESAAPEPSVPEAQPQPEEAPEKPQASVTQSGAPSEAKVEAKQEPKPGVNEMPKKTASKPAPKRVSKPAKPASRSPRSADIQPETPSAQLGAKMAAPSTEGFSVFVGAGHLAGAKGTDRSFTELQAELAYQFSNGSQLGVGETAAKLYEIEPVGEKEFLLDDVAIFFRSRSHEAPAKTALRYMVGVTIPVSEASANAENITRTTLAAELSRTFGRLKLSLTPYGQYFFNRYVSGDSRVPSQRATLGGQAEARVAILRNRLDLVGWGRSALRFYEEYDDSDSAPTPGSQSQYGAHLDLAILRNVSLKGGWLYGNSLVGDVLYTGGRGFYDAPTNRVYAAIGIQL